MNQPECCCPTLNSNVPSKGGTHECDAQDVVSTETRTGDGRIRLKERELVDA